MIFHILVLLTLFVLTTGLIRGRLCGGVTFCLLRFQTEKLLSSQLFFNGLSITQSIKYKTFKKLISNIFISVSKGH